MFQRHWTIAWGAERNNVISRSHVGAGVATNGDVSGTRGGVGKRVLAHGCIAAAGNVKAGFLAHNRVVVADGVERERSLTDGRVIAARYVASERIGAGGRVLEAADVGLERAFPGRGIIDAGSVLSERFMTDGRVKAGTGITGKGNAPLAVFLTPVVLFKSASAPVAVLLSPVLKRSVPAPMAVFKLLVVLQKANANQLLCSRRRW